MKTLLAILLLLSGVAILLLGFPGSKDDLNVVLEREISSASAGFPVLDSYFKADRLRKLLVGNGADANLKFQQVFYHNQDGSEYSALIYPPASGKSSVLLKTDIKAEAWQQLATAISQSELSQQTVLSWWDNSQRIHFYNAAKVWVRSPSAAIFTTSTRAAWQQLSGGFTEDPANLSQLAEWLLMDADSALQAIKLQFPNTTVSLLVSTDDLARLNEMAALSKQPILFQTRVFGNADNLHTLIAQVKRWAADGATGSYLLQKLSATQIRAWRISSKAGEQTLLARLLSFTSSYPKPPHGLQLVYRSKPDAYLSLYTLATTIKNSEPVK